jgi:hypothetical protein
VEIIIAIICFTFLIILLMAVITIVIYKLFIQPAEFSDNEIKLLYGVDFTKTKP